MRTRIKRGLNLPVSGVPDQAIVDGPVVDRVAVLGRDYVGLKPTMLVQEGDRVRLGQPLFTDKTNPDVAVVAPAGGTIRKIRRGARRVLQSVNINVDEHEEEQTFRQWPADRLYSISRGDVVSELLASGLWTSFRTRPYSKVPRPDSDPAAIFVTAMDTNPLAADPQAIIAQAKDDFVNGLTIVAELTEGPLFVCKAPAAEIPVPEIERLQVQEFEGPHPAGLPGTHIHFLHPVGATRTVWHVGVQDVIAIGRLFTTGRLSSERIVAVGGPPVNQPRLVRTRIGAAVAPIIEPYLKPGKIRVLSGPVLSGFRAAGWAAYLGRYHGQISALYEPTEREFLGWIRPGHKKYSVTNVFISSLFRPGEYDINTSQNGSPRAMVPIGSYERVMPLDILATQLLRAILVRDTDMAQKLGCLELDEEDLALCTYVCPGKYDFGPILRENLEQIEKEG
ncbi:MAG: Na(+)-translocating NADH-quinone reductase subunit A [Chromatiales bacterium]|nr:Na(+)-translocating NADH-quinone reductase subunit A [Chromatiales bacterium]